MNSQPVSLAARVLIVGLLGLATVDGAHAISIVKNTGGTATTTTEAPSLKPAALPDRHDVLSVDWVDTKNARLSVGGLMYHVRGAVPSITLVDGTQVKDIGYLKKGARVKIQLANDASGVNRLSEVHVVAAAPASTDAAGQAGATPPATPVGSTAPPRVAGKPQ